MVSPFATTTFERVVSAAGSAVATAGAAGIWAEGTGATMKSLSRLLVGRDIVQLSVQQDGIEGCIAAIVPGFPKQHTVAAGTVVTKRTSATAIAITSCLVTGVLTGCTIY